VVAFSGPLKGFPRGLRSTRGLSAREPARACYARGRRTSAEEEGAGAAEPRPQSRGVSTGAGASPGERSARDEASRLLAQGDGEGRGRVSLAGQRSRWVC